MQDTQKMFWKRFLGIFGENKAEKFLKRKGFKIIKRNYRCRYGEIDIIAKDKGVISFVEVKTVATNAAETPYNTVNSRKKGHISRSALFYLKEKGLNEADCRFDMIAVKYKEGKEPDIELIKGAF